MTEEAAGRAVDGASEGIIIGMIGPAPESPVNPADLTPAERERVCATLRRRFSSRSHGVVGVSLGTAIKQEDGRSDPGRVWAACFYVRGKRRRPPRGRKLPLEVTVRVRRGRHFQTLTLPTDVIDLDRIVATGAELLMPRQGPPPVPREPATGGLLFEWDEPSAFGPTPFQGMLTVGHACDPPNVFGSAGGPVHVRSAGVHSDGRMFARSMAGIDAALTTVDQSKLAIGLVRPVRPLAAVRNDMNRAGKSLRADGPVPLKLIHPPHDPPLGAPWNGIQHNIVIVEATSDAFEPFALGTSGAVWVLDDAGIEQAAMIQIAADPSGFRIGFGQVIDQTTLPWALEQIDVRPGVETASIRVIGGF